MGVGAVEERRGGVYVERRFCFISCCREMGNTFFSFGSVASYALFAFCCEGRGALLRDITFFPTPYILLV